MKRQLKSVAAAAALALGAAFAVSAAHAADKPATGIYAGDWLVRLRAIAITPQVSSSGALNTLQADVNNAIVPELDFTYMVTNNIGAELILGTSRNQVTSSLGALGGVGVLPPTLLLQYHFNNAGVFRPYVGAGINYTLFYNNGLHAGGQPVSIDNHSFGPALQFGVDYEVAKNVFVNADVKKIWMRTGASLNGSSLGTLYIDPIVVGVGVGMKF
ncbi:Outer membrane protein W [Paraburkholderia caffeinitolerans]|uniref:Outer membrane protein W n=1 Tax=Paraburkholderia caffeinitolerans TaxID=1723730 RepID=A0A6J5GH27_9BURK|nr:MULTISPECIES: OmpW family outer membrane protein [Paraburkholderia]CAB3800445.1 Outer membrane protein W [Paraburkholderia caffeinitolerans]